MGFWLTLFPTSSRTVPVSLQNCKLGYMTSRLKVGNICVIQIQIDNAHSRFIAPPEIFNTVRHEILAYEVEGSTFARQGRPMWDGKIRLMDTKGIFPTGLIPLLLEFLKAGEHEYTTHDVRTQPEPNLSVSVRLPEGMAPRPYQVSAVAKTDEVARGVFVMGTGAGKSLTAALVVERRKVPTLVITPDTGLREQLGGDFKKWFGESAVSFDIKSDAPIIVANIQSLVRAKAESFIRFNQLIIDEFHHSAAKTYKQVNQWCLNAYYRFGFTGTFMRSDGNEMELHGVLSHVIFKKTTSELIEEGYLVRPNVTIVRYETKSKYGYRCPYKFAYEHIVADRGFHTLVANLANKKIGENKQTLVLVRRKEHGRALAELIPDAIFLSGDDDVDYREKMKQRFINKQIRCIIATSIFGEGTDIPSIDVLINSRCEKTEIQTKQGVGRALRRSAGKTTAEVFDFLIIGQKHLEQHSVERLNSYRKEPAFVIKVSRPENLL
jgi:superfamily II DNA or RNA helicase